MRSLRVMMAVLLMAYTVEAATKFQLHDAASTVSGYKVADKAYGPSTTPATGVTATVASGTSIQVTKTNGGSVISWITPAFTTQTTVAGTVTMNLWGLESSNSANAKFSAALIKYSGGAEAGSPFATCTMASELSTGNLARTATCTPTSTVIGVGDRIVIEVFVVNSGTMGGPYTTTLNYDRSGAGASGDSFMQINETVSFAYSGTPANQSLTTNPGTPTAVYQRIRNISQGLGLSGSQPCWDMTTPLTSQSFHIGDAVEATKSSSHQAQVGDVSSSFHFGNAAATKRVMLDAATSAFHFADSVVTAKIVGAQAKTADVSQSLGIAASSLCIDKQTQLTTQTVHLAATVTATKVTSRSATTTLHTGPVAATSVNIPQRNYRADISQSLHAKVTSTCLDITSPLTQAIHFNDGVDVSTTAGVKSYSRGVSASISAVTGACIDQLTNLAIQTVHLADSVAISATQPRKDARVGIDQSIGLNPDVCIDFTRPLTNQLFHLATAVNASKQVTRNLTEGWSTGATTAISGCSDINFPVQQIRLGDAVTTSLVACENTQFPAPNVHWSAVPTTQLGHYASSTGALHLVPGVAVIRGGRGVVSNSITATATASVTRSVKVTSFTSFHVGTQVQINTSTGRSVNQSLHLANAVMANIPGKAPAVTSVNVSATATIQVKYSRSVTALIHVVPGWNIDAPHNFSIAASTPVRFSNSVQVNRTLQKSVTSAIRTTAQAAELDNLSVAIAQSLHASVNPQHSASMKVAVADALRWSSQAVASTPAVYVNVASGVHFSATDARVANRLGSEAQALHLDDSVATRLNARRGVSSSLHLDPSSVECGTSNFQSTHVGFYDQVTAVLNSSKSVNAATQVGVDAQVTTRETYNLVASQSLNLGTTVSYTVTRVRQVNVSLHYTSVASNSAARSYVANAGVLLRMTAGVATRSTFSRLLSQLLAIEDADAYVVARQRAITQSFQISSTATYGQLLFRGVTQSINLANSIGLQAPPPKIYPGQNIRFADQVRLGLRVTDPVAQSLHLDARATTRFDRSANIAQDFSINPVVSPLARFTNNVTASASVDFMTRVSYINSRSGFGSVESARFSTSVTIMRGTSGRVTNFLHVRTDVNVFVSNQSNRRRIILIGGM